MEIVVGPVRGEAMVAFATFGRSVLEGPGPGAEVPSDAAAAFFGYIEEWAAIGARGGDVSWATRADPEVIEYLIYAFWRVTKEVNDEAGDAQVVPTDAAPFYWVLVGGLLDALAAEGGSHAEFAANLREFWPGDHEIP